MGSVEGEYRGQVRAEHVKQLKGKIKGLDRFVVMLNDLFRGKIGAFSRWATAAKARVVWEAVSRETRVSQSGGKRVSHVEIVAAMPQVEEVFGKAVYREVQERAQVADIDFNKIFAYEDADMQSEGLVAYPQWQSVTSNLSTGAHEGGRNEDAVAVSPFGMNVFDGVSGGGRCSAKVSRIASCVATKTIETLAREGQLAKMDAGAVVTQVAGDVIEGLCEGTEAQLGLRAGSTGVFLAYDPNRKEIKGGGIGDCAGFRLSFGTTPQCHQFYGTDDPSRNVTNTGGNFVVSSSGMDFSPGTNGSFNVFTEPVTQGDLILVSSDGIADSLFPGEQADALMAVITNPRFDAIPEEGKGEPLKSAAELRAQEPDTPDEVAAAKRLQNYLAWVAIGDKAWNAQLAKPDDQGFAFRRI